MVDDADLLRASLTEPQQFGRLFERHHRAVWTYLARIGGQQAADDLAGEVFTTAFARRSRYDPARGQVRSWLYGIATNLFRNRRRSERRARSAVARVAAEPEPATELITVRAQLLSTTTRAVLDAVGRLSPDERELIALYAWEELPYAEFAAVLGIPVGTVRSRLSRARQRLRGLLATSGHAEALEEIS